MTDILGEALQKLTTPESPLHAEPSGVSVPATAEIVATVPPTVTEKSHADVTPARIFELSQNEESPATRRSPLQVILDHRRQAAAIVVAACVAVYWFEDGSDTTNMNSADSNSAEAAAAEEELMLDEFDAIELTPKREPAEPAEVAAVDPFSLTIPQMGSDSTQVSSPSSEHPLLQESIGDVRNQSAVRAESNDSLEFPAQQSPDNSPPAIPRSVRFTGRIQPLN